MRRITAKNKQISSENSRDAIKAERMPNGSERMTHMSKHNGMSDTQIIPVPKVPPAQAPAQNQTPKRPPTGSDPMAGARQRSVQQNMQMQGGSQIGYQPMAGQPVSGFGQQSRQTGMQSGRQSAMRQPRQSTMRPQRDTGMHPNRQPQRPTGAPPQAGLRRASWDGNYGGAVPPQPPVYAQPPEFQDEEPTPKRRRKRRRKKHSCLRRIVWSIFSLIFTIFAIYSIIAIIAIRKIQHVETGERHLVENAAQADSNIRNILLIGSDSRGDEQGRADTMILLSFSKYNKTLTITSVMRDSYVNIPGHGVNKLNAAYAYGGATLLMDTITNNFGIRVDDYICVNFKAFVHIADAVGGFKIDITDREAQAINVILESEVNGIMGDDPKSDFLPSGGTFVLDGKQALSYARIRYVGNADFERTERQRKVLNLLLDKLKLLSPGKVYKILKHAMPDLSTNMSGGSLYWLSLKLPYQLISYDMQSLRLPADGTYSDQTAPDGQMVLAVDFNANYAIYHDAVTQKGGIHAETQTGSVEYGIQTRGISTAEAPSDGNRPGSPSDTAGASGTDAVALWREAQPQDPERESRSAA